MTDRWHETFHNAYVDLHVAYITLQRMRHERKQSPPDVIERDLGKKDPFGLGAVPGDAALLRWEALWEKTQNDNAMARIMACVTEAMQDHWQSWSAFMEHVPDDLKKFKIAVPFDDYLLTATTVSRSTLEKRAQVLAEARDRRARGAPSEAPRPGPPGGE
jgi:hypothetical protein